MLYYIIYILASEIVFEKTKLVISSQGYADKPPMDLRTDITEPPETPPQCGGRLPSLMC